MIIDPAELEVNRDSSSGEEMLRALEISPEVEYFVSGRRDRFLEDELRTEIYGLPDVRLEDLTNQERSRLRFIAVPTAHIGQHSDDVVKPLKNADYILLESVGMNESQRLGLDMVDNLILRGANISFQSRSLTGFEALGLLTARNDWRIDILRNVSIDRAIPPVFRMIDIAEDDPEYSAEIMMPKSLAIALSPRDLYGKNPAKLAEEAKSQLLSAGAGIRIREEEQFDDISNIAAKAARLHPEREITTIGISMGASHSMVVRHLQTKGFPVEIHWGGTGADIPHDVLREGGSEYGFSLADALIRKAVHFPEQITGEDINCLIAYRLVWEAIKPPPLLMSLASAVNDEPIYITDSIASEAVYALSIEEHAELLKGINHLRAHLGMPGMRAIRLGIATTKINRFVLSYLDEKIGPFQEFEEAVVKELFQR